VENKAECAAFLTCTCFWLQKRCTSSRRLCQPL